jgi:hypothetical protein
MFICLVAARPLCLSHFEERSLAGQANAFSWVLVPELSRTYGQRNCGCFVMNTEILSACLLSIQRATAVLNYERHV